MTELIFAGVLMAAVGIVATRPKDALETTGRPFGDQCGALRQQEAAANTEIEQIGQKRFDVGPIVAGTSAEAEIAVSNAQWAKRRPLIAIQREKLRKLGYELDQLHQARAAEVHRLRLRAELGCDPVTPAIPAHWSADDSYIALLTKHGEIEVRHATLTEEHGRCLAISDQARTRLRESAVARLSGETTAGKHASAERARDDAATALATVTEQLQVHTDALLRVDRQKAELATDLRARWLDALTATHAEVVQRFAGHLRLALASAPALDAVAGALERASTSGAAVTRAPSGFDTQNPETPVRRWLDSVISAGLL